MFEKFSETFSPDTGFFPDVGDFRASGGASDFDEFIRRFGGGSFRSGLYRVIRAQDLMEWKQRVVVGFPEFESRIVCFGFDWAGSVFAIDSGRLVSGEPGVIIFEPGTGQALNVPSNFRSFHDIGLSEFGEAALGIEFHQKWLASGGTMPKYDQCVGYKKPLFFGGVDDIQNLEISDLSVYWHLMGQFIRKARGFPNI